MLGQQLALGRQDDVRRFLLHPLLDQRHRHAGQIRAERLKAQEQRAIDRAEKPRHALHVENVNQLIGRPVRPPRAERLIGELRQRRLVVRRLDHPIQFRLLPPLLRRLQLARPLAQARELGESLAALPQVAKRQRLRPESRRARGRSLADRWFDSIAGIFGRHCASWHYTVSPKVYADASTPVSAAPAGRAIRSVRYRRMSRIEITPASLPSKRIGTCR